MSVCVTTGSSVAVEHECYPSIGEEGEEQGGSRGSGGGGRR